MHVRRLWIVLAAFGAALVASAAALAQVPIPAGFTGGQYTTRTGETVTLYSDASFTAADPAYNQRWADLLASLPHGSELSKLTAFLATPSRISRLCGLGALGCYGSGHQLISIGQDVQGATATGVLIHEYGHHIANNRDNRPFEPLDYGTKRWASYANVCKRAQEGELAPGDEGRRYTVNPGEVFAETYRVLAERTLGLPESTWDLVEANLYPDQTALDLVRQDVLEPWPGNSTVSYRGQFKMGGKSGITYGLPTAYDGDVEVTLTAPRGASFELRVKNGADGSVLESALGPSQTKTVTVPVCGERLLVLGVRRASGSGSFTLKVSKP